MTSYGIYTKFVLQREISDYYISAGTIVFISFLCHFSTTFNFLLSLKTVIHFKFPKVSKFILKRLGWLDHKPLFVNEPSTSPTTSLQLGKAAEKGEPSAPLGVLSYKNNRGAAWNLSYQKLAKLT